MGKTIDHLSKADSVRVSLGGAYTEAIVYVLLLTVMQTATDCKSAWNIFHGIANTATPINTL